MRQWIWGVIAVCLAGCGGMQVEVIENRGFPEGMGDGYRWLEPALDDDADASLRALDTAVREGLDRCFAQRGYQRVDAGEAALGVSYRVSQHTRYSEPGPISPRDSAEGIREASDRRATMDGTINRNRVLDQVELMELYFSLAAADSGRVLWRAVARDTMTRAPAADTLQALAKEAVAEVCGHVPRR